MTWSSVYTVLWKKTFKSKLTDIKSVLLGVISKIQTTGLMFSTSTLSEGLRTNKNRSEIGCTKNKTKKKHPKHPHHKLIVIPVSFLCKCKIKITRLRMV